MFEITHSLERNASLMLHDGCELYQNIELNKARKIRQPTMRKRVCFASTNVWETRAGCWIIATSCATIIEKVFSNVLPMARWLSKSRVTLRYVLAKDAVYSQNGLDKVCNFEENISIQYPYNSISKPFFVKCVLS